MRRGVRHWIKEHRLDFDEGFDELDEIDDDMQQALCWCTVHETWEWHWVPRELTGQ
jgi:hypothetical protein